MTTTPQTEASRLASALDAINTNNADSLLAQMAAMSAAAELRRLDSENQQLKTSLALVQQHHATAWNRGHQAGLRAGESAIKQATDAVNQQLTTEPVDERDAFESEMARRESWTACDFRPHPRRGEYPHPDYLASYANAAWAGWQARAATAQVSDINVVESFTNDTEDAKRYRWLADSNNYYEAINLISDGSLTEDALGKAIDAAMAKGVK